MIDPNLTGPNDTDDKSRMHGCMQRGWVIAWDSRAWYALGRSLGTQ